MASALDNVGGAPPDSNQKLKPPKKKQQAGTTYEHEYMTRRDRVYPITETEMSTLSVTTATSGFLGAAASWALTKAVDAHMELEALRVADATDAARVTSVAGTKETMIILGVVFAVIAVGGWLVRGSILSKIKKQSKAQVVS